MSQTRAHFLEGGKREECIGELGNVACHNKDSLAGGEEDGCT